MKIVVGKGNTVKFWEDKWCGSISLAEQFKRLYTVSQQQHHLIVDVGCWDGERWQWELRWRRNMFLWETELVAELMGKLESYLPKADFEDSLSWELTSNKVFSVRSLTGSINASRMQSCMDRIVAKFIWLKISPPRAQMTLWLLSHNRLQTGARLYRKRIIDEDEAQCTFCNNEIEELEHLFFICPPVWEAWMKISRWWGILLIIHRDPIVNIKSWQSLMKKRKLKPLWNTVFHAMIWTIWNERNKIRFEGSPINWEWFLEKVKFRICLWIKECQKQTPYGISQMMTSMQAILE